MEIARKPASMKLAMRIRVARQYAKLSQAELAEKLGISRGAVANWESANDAHPATSRMVKLAVLTGVSSEWLVTGRGRMTHESGGEEVPAVDGEFVHDIAERQLLDAFRRSPARAKSLILQMAESHAPTARKLRRTLHD
ncbi:MAG TPA: helix-turn-helix transcriptional regulator [Pseudoxanthomonas sp.]|nr:helix-turn-helix transcriptional regulator [Pseudoxanthomonas sp.]